jgi:hypothetical protein
MAKRVGEETRGKIGRSHLRNTGKPEMFEVFAQDMRPASVDQDLRTMLFKIALLLDEDCLRQHDMNAFVAVDQLGDVYVAGDAG